MLKSFLSQSAAYMLACVLVVTGTANDDAYIEDESRIAFRHMTSSVADGSTVYLSIMEEPENGTVVYTVQAQDKDIIMDAVFNYSLVVHSEDHNNGLLQLNNNTGEVIVIGIIDYEQMSAPHQLHLTVKATELEPHFNRSALLNLCITVEDDPDDNSALFRQILIYVLAAVVFSQIYLFAVVLK